MQAPVSPGAACVRFRWSDTGAEAEDPNRAAAAQGGAGGAGAASGGAAFNEPAQVTNHALPTHALMRPNPQQVADIGHWVQTHLSWLQGISFSAQDGNEGMFEKHEEHWADF